MRTVFATISKNNSENLQIAMEVYKKNPVIDCRVPAGNDKMTTKGLTLGLRKWRELLPIITAAVEEFERQLADPESEFARESGR